MLHNLVSVVTFVDYLQCIVISEQTVCLQCITVCMTPIDSPVPFVALPAVGLVLAREGGPGLSTGSVRNFNLVVVVVVLKMSERRSKDLYVQILHNTV